MKLNIFGASAKRAVDGTEEGRVVGRLEVSGVRVKRILVAVDFSEASRGALAYAVALAKKLEAEIVLVHVFEGVPGELKILEATVTDTGFREEARESLAEWEREVGAAGVTTKAVFREGGAIDREILEAAKEYKPDLMVVGRHGSESFFLKNTVRKVLGQAPCPVLVGP